MSQTGVGARPSPPDAVPGGSVAERGAEPRRRTLALAGDPGAVTVGRHFVRQALADWHWIPDPPDPSRQTVAADVLLLVSELIANASLHAGGPTELVVGVDAEAGALRLEVTDGDPALPVAPSPHLPGLPGGHGLYIVERLADRWGATPGGGGKTVWAEIDLSRLDADLTPAPAPAGDDAAPAAQE